MDSILFLRGVRQVFLLFEVLKRQGLFVAQGDRGIEAAGAPGGDVAGGASDKNEGDGGQGEGEGIVGREAEELALHDAGEHQ